MTASPTPTRGAFWEVPIALTPVMLLPVACSVSSS